MIDFSEMPYFLIYISIHTIILCFHHCTHMSELYELPSLVHHRNTTCIWEWQMSSSKEPCSIGYTYIKVLCGSYPSTHRSYNMHMTIEFISSNNAQMVLCGTYSHAYCTSATSIYLVWSSMANQDSLCL